MLFPITKGLDIPIAGAPEAAIEGRPAVSSVALLGADYVGLSPAMRVQEGETVKLGQALFCDRKRPEILFTSPGTGVVARINRGARRALLSVVVRLEGDAELTFPSWPAGQLTDLSREQVTENLLASGLWTAFRTRPYSKVAEPDGEPHSIFVTAVDSNPLAPRPGAAIAEHPSDFANGLTVVSRLTTGAVFVCTAPDIDLRAELSDRVTLAEFSGPHPSGLVGTHIHVLDPVGPAKTVWHVGYQDVIAIGKLFTSGRIWTERIIALAGPAVSRPRLVRARLGVDTEELTRGELADGDARVVSGSVLSGRRVWPPVNYLGRYHNQVSAVAEARGPDRAPPAGADKDAFSTYNLFVSNQPRKRKFAFTTALHGRPRAMVPFGGYERVTPIDILPTPLLRALLVGDTDTAQALGALELDEEDLALCSFVCPGKLNYGPMLRDALVRIEKEG